MSDVYTLMGDMGQSGTFLEGVYASEEAARNACDHAAKTGHCDRYYVARRPTDGGPGVELYSVPSEESKRAWAEWEEMRAETTTGPAA